MINFVGSAKFLLVTSLCLQHVSGDTLVIEKVTCKHVAVGIDAGAKALASTIGAIVAGGATALGGATVVVGTGGAAVGTIPVTATAVVSAAAGGASAAKEALEYIDKLTSGKDNLVINVNGQKVFPTSGQYFDIKAGETIRPNVRFDFDGKARIQLIEYDWGSDNDNLGWIDIVDDVSPGQDYRVNEAIVFSKEEGDVYYVTYKVERNDKGGKESWLLCGTSACKTCSKPGCTSTSNSGLDRDGDKGDLRKCPPGFKHQGYKKYVMLWPFDDVYLRICSQHAGCMTKSGDKPWTKCKFPFNFSGAWYHGCTKKSHNALWCSTKTDQYGNHLSGNWGNCNDDCK